MKRWNAGHDRQRELFSDDAEPCGSREQPRTEAEHLRVDAAERVVRHRCGEIAVPNLHDMTYYCPECEVTIDPAERVDGVDR
jgi:hypothetical protein